MTDIHIPDLLRHRASISGEPGAQWLSGLNDLLAEISANWQLSVGRQRSGGTEALVFDVEREDGPAVLKVGLPGTLKKEARTLQLAHGRGYAKLLNWDPQREALLLERLGGRLAEQNLPAADQIRIICATLITAWQPVSDPAGLTTGAEKARVQGAFIATQWEALQHPCPESLIDQALRYASTREAAYQPDLSLLVHGDAHIWNTLALPGTMAEFKFVDPDGLFAEPALDLSISLREWRDELLAGDTLRVGRQRCELLSRLTGVEFEAIWQWGYIEHVSCGLLDLQLDDQRAADQHFAIANHWLDR